MRLPTLLLMVSTAAILSACATSGRTFPTPDPIQIPDFEAEVEADSTDVDAVLLLAAAYREANRTADAMTLVETTRVRRPDRSELTAMAGLLHEEAGAYETAAELYQRYLSDAPSGPLAEEVSRRLELARREALREDVRRALAREAELADMAPDPAALGIFPFVYEGGDPQWAPLGPALAELLITDLAITGRLTVLERTKVQSLVDELALSESGLVEPSTAARSGRLLGSGHVVQGRVRVTDGRRIGVDAALVSLTSTSDTDVEPLAREGALETLFDLEKELALDLHAELGIQLTPAERVRVSERHTENVQALLAFGRGLMAADRGDFQAAETQFAEATRLDPAFALAAQRRASAARAGQVGSRRSFRRMTGRVTRVAQRRRAVQALRALPAGVRGHVLRQLGQRKRAVLAEVLGQDRVGAAILLELVFRAPGGSR